MTFKDKPEKNPIGERKQKFSYNPLYFIQFSQYNFLANKLQSKVVFWNILSQLIHSWKSSMQYQGREKKRQWAVESKGARRHRRVRYNSQFRLPSPDSTKEIISLKPSEEFCYQLSIRGPENITPRRILADKPMLLSFIHSTNIY